MNLDDLRRLNIRDIGNWPLLPKIAILRRDLRGDHRRRLPARLEGPVGDARGRRSRGRLKLKDQYTQKKAKAINFELYVQQLNEVEQSFGALVKQLPNRSEIDALLTDINQAGLGRGLQFELFRPAAQEKMSDFYAELPIKIRITGSYHDMGAFASDIAQLPRIVTLNDLVDRQRQGRARAGCGREDLPLPGRGRDRQAARDRGQGEGQGQEMSAEGLLKALAGDNSVARP